MLKLSKICENETDSSVVVAPSPGFGTQKHSVREFAPEPSRVYRHSVRAKHRRNPLFDS
jgi:hypothetical protein